MFKQKTKVMMSAFLICSVCLLMGADGGGCGEARTTPKSASGVSKATVTVPIGSDGLTVEQRNVKERLARDNKVGSIKHLYIISAFSGDVIIYSTVRSKVTSSSKRLTPNTVAAADGQYVSNELGGIPVRIGNKNHRTAEVLQDDGTYGSSIGYLYWFDSKDVYHQHYVTGGQIVHITDQPLTVPKIIINMETSSAK